jgi:hypothetical protein
MAARKRLGPGKTLEGYLSALWGDPASRRARRRTTRYLLVDPANRFSVDLQVDRRRLRRLGSPTALNGQRVRITGTLIEPKGKRRRRPPLRVRSVELLPAGPTAEARPFLSFTGATPWVNILCKYAGTETPSEGVDYFRELMAGTPTSLASYFHEASYGQVQLGETAAVHGWFTLPRDEASYVTPEEIKFDDLVRDAIAAAEGEVHFPDHFGINLWFNGGVGCCNWCLRRNVHANGVDKEYSVAWLPRPAFHDFHSIAHEMGHGYNMWHQRADNPWDVMATGSGTQHERFGRVDVHMTAFQKDLAGWLPAERKRQHPAGRTERYTVARLAKPITESPLMIAVPIAGAPSRFYTIEARVKVGYDAGIPRNAVVIHEVDLTLDDPSVIVANPANPDGGWTVGERLLRDDFRLHVDGMSDAGFEVTVTT